MASISPLSSAISHSPGSKRGEADRDLFPAVERLLERDPSARRKPRSARHGTSRRRLRAGTPATVDAGRKRERARRLLEVDHHAREPAGQRRSRATPSSARGGSRSRGRRSSRTPAPSPRPRGCSVDVDEVPRRGPGLERPERRSRRRSIRSPPSRQSAGVGSRLAVGAVDQPDVRAGSSSRHSPRGPPTVVSGVPVARSSNARTSPQPPAPRPPRSRSPGEARRQAHGPARRASPGGAPRSGSSRVGPGSGAASPSRLIQTGGRARARSRARCRERGSRQRARARLRWHRCARRRLRQCPWAGLYEPASRAVDRPRRSGTPSGRAMPRSGPGRCSTGPRDRQPRRRSSASDSGTSGNGGPARGAAGRGASCSEAASSRPSGPAVLRERPLHRLPVGDRRAFLLHQRLDLVVPREQRSGSSSGHRHVRAPRMPTVPVDQRPVAVERRPTRHAASRISP